MLTTRGRWFIIVVGMVLFWSVTWFAFHIPMLAIFGFTLLTWFLAEWVLFLLRLRFATQGLTLERTIIQTERVQPNFWANVRGTVRVTIALKRSAWKLPFVALADKLPAGQNIIRGLRRTAGPLRVGSPIVLEYDIQPAAPGVVQFEGVEVRISDLCGFFYHRLFLRVPMEYLVLPMLAGDEGAQRSTKRLNSLPPPGVHRLRRPGGGSELLNLREYRPGDPPKTVAWKASARRDMLITKEFENDVPVRCTLFLDASNAMRLGETGNTPLARGAGIAAAVAQAAAANRDVVGLTVFDERTVTGMKPARKRIHTMQMLRLFSETAARQPEHTIRDVPFLQRLALSLARELYPELLEKRVNSRPLGLFWRPLLDSRAKWLLLIPIAVVYSLFTSTGLNTAFSIVNSIVRPDSPQDLIPFGIVFVLLVSMPTVLAAIYWFIFGIRGIFPPRSRLLSERKQLGALFAALDDDSPSALERHIHDDEFFSARVHRFLVEHRAVPPPELYDEHGHYRFRGEGKLDVLRDALVRSVGTAKDNELYIVLADLVELGGELEPLLGSIRAARGRHHQVLVLMPWPSDVPTPEERKEQQDEQRKRAKLSIKGIIEDSLISSYIDRYEKARTQLIRSGATVLRFNQHDAVKLILQRLEQLRSARIRR